MSKASRDATENIEEQILDMAYLVFYIVTENPEIPHIPYYVKPSAVEEHGSEKR